MSDEPVVERRIRVQTASFTCQGALRLSPRLRTLDELNVVTKNFVTLYPPGSASSFHVEEGPFAVNKSSILFVHELSNPPLGTGRDFGQFTRAAMRVRIGAFEIQGFVFMPPGGEPMRRLDQGHHPFVALTSALVTGPDTEFTAPFVAVHRGHVVAVQRVSSRAEPQLAATHVEHEAR